MATFNIDGLKYTDKLPHSRIEKILYEILKNQGGGGGADLIVDDPSDVGNGLMISNNKIAVNAVNTMDDSGSPITAGAVYNQLVLAGDVMARI